MKIKTALHALKYLESEHVEISEGEIYDIFSCGCIRDKHGKKCYAQINDSRLRVCEYHKDALLLGKFKRCFCGAIHFQKNLRAGKSCNKCKLAALRAAYHRHKNKSLSPHRNKSKRDISRFDCLHRTSCLSKYDEYDVLPCKKCIKYIPGGFDVELAKQDKIGMTID